MDNSVRKKIDEETSYERLIKILAMQKTIQYIDQAIAISETFDGLINNVLTAITMNGQWVVSCYWDVEVQENENLRLLNLHSLDTEKFHDFINITRQIHFKSGEGLPGSVQTIKYPLWITDIVECNNFPRKAFAIKNGLKGGMAFPVMIRDVLIGVIELFSTHELESFYSLDSEFMGIGARVGQAISKLKAEQQFKNEQKRFQVLLQAVSNSVMISITNIRGEVIFTNNIFLEMTGYKAEEILGVNYRVINSGTHPKEFFEELWSTISSGKIWKGEICNRKKNGTLYWVENTITPMKNENGETQYLSIQHDITAKKCIENKLLGSEEIWKLALAETCDGIWDWNINKKVITFSKKSQELMGHLDDEVTNDFEEWAKCIHPDDLAGYKREMDSHFEGKENFYKEYRVLCKDGTYKMILDRSVLTDRDLNGNPTRIIGIYSQVLDKKTTKYL